MENAPVAVMEKKKRRLPPFAGWLLGYVCILAATAGLVYYWRVVFELGALPMLPTTLVGWAVASFLYLLAFLLFHFLGNKVCLRAALCVFVLGLLFCAATPPLQAPDEDDHYRRAYSISQGHFDFDYDRFYPKDVALLMQHFPQFMNHLVSYEGHQLAPAGFANYWDDLHSGAQPAQSPREPIRFMVVTYLPQAAFMAVARLLGFSALGLMYAGRLANLLVYALLCYLIFKNCDKYRGVFYAITMLPLSLFLAASCSNDALVLALCFLCVSYFCKAEIHTRDVIVFGIAVLFITYIKPPSIAMAAVLLLIPKPRWKSRVNPRLAFVAILVAAVAVYLAFSALYGGPLNHNYPAQLPRGSGVAADPMGQIWFVLQHPLRYISVALLSLYENAGFLFRLGLFGWTDLSIPLVSGLSVLSLCAASALGIQQKDDTKTGGAVGLFLAAMLYAGTALTGMYLFDTDYSSVRITGAQPRYFLPAFLLLFMLASILLGKAVQPRLPRHTGAAEGGALAQSRTETVTLYIVVGLALLAAVLVFQNYFVGQWLPKAEGGYRLVNMLGWVQT